MEDRPTSDDAAPDDVVEPGDPGPPEVELIGESDPGPPEMDSIPFSGKPLESDEVEWKE